MERDNSNKEKVIIIDEPIKQQSTPNKMSRNKSEDDSDGKQNYDD
jgi:hypothetical protein